MAKKNKKTVLLAAGAGLAVAAMIFVASANWQVATLTTPGTNRVLTLPPEADNASVIFLGAAVDPVTGEAVEGYAFIHPKKGYAHRPGHTKGGVGGKCFAFISNGAKWKTVEPWLVNATNTRSLASSFVFDNLSIDISKWEDGADGVVGDGLGVDILGNGTLTNNVLTAETTAPDGQNEVYFANVSSPGAIAVTTVWGVFSGPIGGRKIVEWDQVYDDVDFDWSATGEAGKMDFENIATHELGHTDGMGHPDDACTEETMFRFSDFSETKKRDLNTGDISGINNLY